jgi:hypothetical protein
MPNHDVELLIGDVLGSDADRWIVQVDQAEYCVFVSHAPLTLDAADSLVSESWRRCHARNIRIFVGVELMGIPPFPVESDAYRVFAVPGLPVSAVPILARTSSSDEPRLSPGEIIELADGHGNPKLADLLRKHSKALSHAMHGISRRSPETLSELLNRISSISDFEIVFADRYAINAVFVAPVSVDGAKRIAEALIDAVPESLGDMDDVDAASIPEFLLKTHGFRLSWT